MLHNYSFVNLPRQVIAPRRLLYISLETASYTLPILALQLTFSEDLNFNMKMDVEILKQWDGWGTSRAYLEAIGDNFCIVTLANEYFVLIQGFYSWLIQRQQELHQADFENLRQMEEELRNIVM